MYNSGKAGKDFIFAKMIYTSIIFVIFA